MLFAEENAVKACCTGKTCSPSFLREVIVSGDGLLKFQWLYQMRPYQFVQQYLKPPLVISLHLQRDLNNQEGNVCFAVSWLTLVPGFIKLLHSPSVLKDACVTWIPFHTVTLDPLMSRQLNYLLQPLFLPKRFRLR